MAEFEVDLLEDNDTSHDNLDINSCVCISFIIKVVRTGAVLAQMRHPVYATVR